MASSSSAKRCTVTTGPKTSFCTISSVCFTSTTTVGWTKKPRLPFVPPPVSTVAPFARSRKPRIRSCCACEITEPISISSLSIGSPTFSDSTCGTSSSSSLS